MIHTVTLKEMITKTVASIPYTQRFFFYHAAMYITKWEIKPACEEVTY